MDVRRSFGENRRSLIGAMAPKSPPAEPQTPGEAVPDSPKGPPPAPVLLNMPDAPPAASGTVPSSLPPEPPKAETEQEPGEYVIRQSGDSDLEVKGSASALSPALKRAKSSSGQDSSEEPNKAGVATNILRSESIDNHAFFGPFKSGRGRVLHGPRYAETVRKPRWVSAPTQDEQQTSATSIAADAPKSGTPATVSGRMFSAGRFLSSKLMGVTSAAAQSLGLTEEKVNEGTFCDGCGMMPIIGNLWECSQCPNYTLCQSCYEKGKHGLENDATMAGLVKKWLMEDMKHRYKGMPERLIEVLMKEACKDRLEKFEYLGSWIGSLISGKPVAKLQVRGVEIPRLTAEARQEMVQLLMPIVIVREDIEVFFEWDSESYMFCCSVSDE